MLDKKSISSLYETNRVLIDMQIRPSKFFMTGSDSKKLQEKNANFFEQMFKLDSFGDKKTTSP